MKLVDVHCHLTHERFKKDLGRVIERAKKAGVKVIVCSGVNHPTNLEVLELSKKYDIVGASLGLYPIDLLGLGPDEVGLTRQTSAIDLDKELKFIEKNVGGIVAIGECGLDYYWSKKPVEHEKQKENFKKIIKFAVRIKKPLIIHSRDAEEDCLDILEQEVKGEIPIIMHCFSGRKSLMSRAIELGYYFSIPASIVKSTNFQTLVKKAELDHLLTETDAPWLSPFSGERNEPAFVVESVKKIALIKEISLTEVANQIWKNYQDLFG